MSQRISKTGLMFVGFVAGVAFILSCDSGKKVTNAVAQAAIKAIDVVFSVQNSSLTSTTVQGAIDQLDTKVTTHTHTASEIISGTIDIARLPLGATSATVSRGDHTHPIGPIGNADTVDGLDASATPIQNHLLALDLFSKFPNSVLMTGHGNNLDADTVDGQHGSAFAAASHNHSQFADTVTFQPQGSNRNIVFRDSNGADKGFIRAETLDIFNIESLSGADLRLDANGRKVQVAGTLEIQGSCTVTGQKCFVQDHPEDPKKEIIYVSLEGGESGTYCRGSGQLENGKVVIELPGHFALVTEEEGLTVQVTPTSPCFGLWVEKKSTGQIAVAELGAGQSNATFDWLVNGVRKGYADFKVIRDKK